jgi:hypothetical protein
MYSDNNRRKFLIIVFTIWVCFLLSKNALTQVTSLTPSTNGNPPVGMHEWGEYFEKHPGHPVKIHSSLNLATLNPPTNLKITPGDGLAFLSWDPVPDALGYAIYASDDGKKFKLKFKKPIKSTNISIGVLENGKTYYFGVQTVGNGAVSKKTVQTVIPRKGM